jgi:hypothetical protein
MQRALLACCLAFILALGAQARTFSVVAFQSEYGVVLLDSAQSKAAFRLFEALNVAVENRVVAETKIFAPTDGSFRIACTGSGADYACAVTVYAGAHATLDFDSDKVELTLPGELARRYEGVFPAAGGGFHFETEDERLTIDWSRERLHILAPGKTQRAGRGQKT